MGFQKDYGYICLSSIFDSLLWRSQEGWNNGEDKNEVRFFFIFITLICLVKQNDRMVRLKGFEFTHGHQLNHENKVQWCPCGWERGKDSIQSAVYSALEPLSSSSSSSSPSLITSFLIEPNVNRLSLDLAFGRRRTDFFWYIYLSVCISSQADEASHHTVRIRYLATVCLTWCGDPIRPYL